MVTSNEFRSASTNGVTVRRCSWPFLAAASRSGTSGHFLYDDDSSEAVTRLQQTAGLIEDVKAFGKTLGIEPTEALSRTAGNGPALSMLWLWMQREGTLALADR